MALTSEVESTVAELDAAVQRAATAFCTQRRDDYRVQIGYADGSARDLSDDDCTEGYPILLEAIGRQEARGLPQSGWQAPRCPDRSGVVGGRAGPFPTAGDLPDVRRLRAVAASRCEYRGLDLVVGSDVEDPEALRAILLSTWSNAIVDCSPRPTGVVTALVFRLADGSTHRAVVDGRSCGTTTLDGLSLGPASPQLAELARRR